MMFGDDLFVFVTYKLFMIFTIKKNNKYNSMFEDDLFLLLTPYL